MWYIISADQAEETATMNHACEHFGYTLMDNESQEFVQ